MSKSPISADSLLGALEDPELHLVDVRSSDAYNGWPVEGCPRGGHIPSARSLPAKWLGYLDWPEIVESKGLDPGRRIILYGGTDPDALEQTAHRLKRSGYEEVAIYHDFPQEWSARRDLPLESLPRYRQLVPPWWLKDLLTTGTAAQYDNDRYVLCHGHYQNRGDYEQGHIPGAIEIDTNSLESPETWNRRSPGELAQALQQAGITHDTTVILYGRFSEPDYDDPFPGSSAGHLGSIRCALIMLYAGVKDVRVLNGGIQSWLDAGHDLTTDETPRRPVESFGAKIPGRADLFVDTPEAKEILDSPDANLVSVRSWREIIGQMSGYHYIQKKGRIPGAVFGNCGSDAYHMENYRNVDHTTREYGEISRMWREIGIVPEKRNVFYCGTGWRASEAFLNAWLMGFTDIAVYDGGWYEWSSDESNPYQTGVPTSAGASSTASRE